MKKATQSIENLAFYYCVKDEINGQFVFDQLYSEDEQRLIELATDCDNENVLLIIAIYSAEIEPRKIVLKRALLMNRDGFCQKICQEKAKSGFLFSVEEEDLFRQLRHNNKARA